MLNNTKIFMETTDSYLKCLQSYIKQFEKYEKTHPNISAYWILYLQNKITHFKKVCRDAELALSTIDVLNKDVPLDSILTLQCLFNQANDNT